MNINVNKVLDHTDAIRFPPQYEQEIDPPTKLWTPPADPPTVAGAILIATVWQDILGTNRVALAAGYLSTMKDCRMTWIYARVVITEGSTPVLLIGIDSVTTT
jgi:hypothetical protein